MVNPRSRSRIQRAANEGSPVGFDISKFEGAVSKIPALWDIADATPAPEDADLVSVLDRLGNPDAVTIITIAAEGTGGFAD